MTDTLRALVERLDAGIAQGGTGPELQDLLQNIVLTDYGAAPEADWSAFFEALIALWRSPDPEVGRLALHWLGAAGWLIRRRNGPLRSSFPQDFPIDRCLAAARLYAARGGDNLYRIFDQTQSLFHRLEDAPRPVRRLYDGLTGWLQMLKADDPRYAAVRPGIIKAAQSAFLPLPAWPTARDLLLRRIESAEHDIARAAAAWRIGQFYLAAAEADGTLDPPLLVMASRLAAIDIARPGVAGPFLGAFINDLDRWWAADGPDPKAYILDILEHRKAPEPDTIPVSNGLDFYAQEMLTTREDIRRLARIGQRGIAQACACEAGLDLEALLEE